MPKKKKFEYLVTHFTATHHNDAARQECLNTRGKNGWELVSVVDNPYGTVTTCYFKRELK